LRRAGCWYPHDGYGVPVVAHPRSRGIRGKAVQCPGVASSRDSLYPYIGI
jgi:hypothetical protein